MEFEQSDSPVTGFDRNLRLARLHMLFRDWKAGIEALNGAFHPECSEFIRKAALPLLRIAGAHTGNAQLAPRLEFVIQECKRESTIFFRGESPKDPLDVRHLTSAPALIARELVDRAMMLGILESWGAVLEVCEKILVARSAEPADRAGAHLLKAFVFLIHEKLVEAQHQMLSAQSLLLKCPDDELMKRFHDILEPRVGW